MPIGRPPRVLAAANPLDAEPAVLRVVEVWWNGCVLSDGRELFIRYEKLATLCLELVQAGWPITARTTWARIKQDDTELVEELIEIHRVGSTHVIAATRLEDSSDVF